MRPFILTAICLLCLCLSAHADETQADRGLQFRSYEVSPDLRTSLRIPASGNSALRYKGFLSLSFDIKINTSKECFGYICRILLDNRECIDLLLTNPANEEIQAVLASRDGELHRTALPKGRALNSWHKVDINLQTRDGITSVDINGEAYELTCMQEHFHEAVIYFGANQSGTFTTSDVAPMSIRDVSVSNRSQQEDLYFWELSHEADLRNGTGRKGMPASVENPEWILANSNSWRLASTMHFGSKAKIIPDPERNLIYFVAKDGITTYDTKTGATENKLSHQDISFHLLTNDFAVLPDGRLMYFNPEGTFPKTSIFDTEEGRWTEDIKRTRHSKYLHHNTLCNKCDSSIVQMFGYGFHRYSNDIISWNEQTGDFRKWVLDSIPHRYLSAIGISDSLAYIYGGKGNKKGIQEQGTMIYNDLYALDLTDYEVRKLWEFDADSLEVAAADLIISDDGKSFTALFYPPNTYQSRLQLRKVSIEDGTMKTLGNSIPYSFLDIESEARLLYDKEAGTYYAATVQKGDSNSYKAEIYRISAPVASAAHYDPHQGKDRKLMTAVMLILTAAAASCIFIVLKRRARTRVTETKETVPDEVLKPGIYLIGGFRAINRAGEDISSSFTPLMKQLLSLLILNSYRQKGISSTELKETLWDDKSEESYYNNRGVNIKKLRNVLQEVGEMEISSANGNWAVTSSGETCDWHRHLSMLESLDIRNLTGGQIEEVLRTASKGQLLPEMRYDWTDRFKAQYTECIINTLNKINEAYRKALSYQQQIRIADAILLFDSLDEDAVKAKCRALISQKRLGIAESTFKNFTQEYRRLMGEDYITNFTEFIK